MSSCSIQRPSRLARECIVNVYDVGFGHYRIMPTRATNMHSRTIQALQSSEEYCHPYACRLQQKCYYIGQAHHTGCGEDGSKANPRYRFRTSKAEQDECSTPVRTIALWLIWQNMTVRPVSPFKTCSREHGSFEPKALQQIPELLFGTLSWNNLRSAEHAYDCWPSCASDDSWPKATGLLHMRAEVKPRRPHLGFTSLL